MTDNEDGVSPLTIDIMLACYVSPEPQSIMGTTWASAAGVSVRQWLRRNDLIDDRERATERGKAWVKFICATPMPVATWTMPARS